MYILTRARGACDCLLFGLVERLPFIPTYSTPALDILRMKQTFSVDILLYAIRSFTLFDTYRLLSDKSSGKQ